MRRMWSEKEVEVLRKIWHSPQVSRQNIDDVFPDRTYHAIKCKAHSLGLPPRTSVETNINEELLSKLMKVVDG